MSTPSAHKRQVPARRTCHFARLASVVALLAAATHGPTCFGQSTGSAGENPFSVPEKSEPQLTFVNQQAPTPEAAPAAPVNEPLPVTIDSNEFAFAAPTLADPPAMAKPRPPRFQNQPLPAARPTLAAGQARPAPRSPAPFLGAPARSAAPQAVATSPAPTQNQARPASFLAATSVRNLTPSGGALIPVHVVAVQRMEPVQRLAQNEPRRTQSPTDAAPVPPSQLQPVLPMPTSPPALPTTEGGASGARKASPPAGNAANGGRDQKLGEEPPKSTNNLQFLRRQAVLLEPGDWQVDVGIAYSLFEDRLPINLVDGGGNLVSVVEGNIDQRVALIPFEVRLGVTENAQLFCSVPVGWAGTQLSFPGTETHEDVSGLADLRAGASLLLLEGDGCCPDVVATLAFTAPTGEVGATPIGIAPGAQLGEGFWAASANLLWIHTIDPVVIFYGGGYRHRFDADLDGVDVNPGEEFNLTVGVGFAVNPCVTLSAAYAGAYLTQYEGNGVDLAGTALEISRMRFSVTIARGEKLVEPFAEVGMSDDAPGTRIGVVWTY